MTNMKFCNDLGRTRTQTNGPLLTNHSLIVIDMQLVTQPWAPPHYQLRHYVSVFV